jgi:hypothetical protein
MLEPGAMLSIGPLHFSASVLSVVLALLLYGFWIKRVEEKLEGVQSFLQAGSNALLAGLLLYKLWPVLEAGKAVWLQPSRWLLYSGGAYGLEAAAVGGLLVFALQAFRGKWPLERTIEWTLSAFAFLAAVYSIVVKQYGVETEGWGWVLNGSYYLPVNALHAGVMVLLIAMLTFSRSRAHFVRRERIGLLLMGIGLWAILYVALTPSESIQTGWRSYREEMGLASVYADAWILLRRRS